MIELLVVTLLRQPASVIRGELGNSNSFSTGFTQPFPDCLRHQQTFPDDLDSSFLLPHFFVSLEILALRAVISRFRVAQACGQHSFGTAVISPLLFAVSYAIAFTQHV